jgi:hypothetical protein
MRNSAPPASTSWSLIYPRRVPCSSRGRQHQFGRRLLDHWTLQIRVSRQAAETQAASRDISGPQRQGARVGLDSLALTEDDAAHLLQWSCDGAQNASAHGPSARAVISLRNNCDRVRELFRGPTNAEKGVRRQVVRSTK